MGSGLAARKQSGQRFFSPQLILHVYRGDPMVLLQRKLDFSKDPEGVQHFLWGVGGGEGPNAKFYKNPYHM